jgi:hypothetical protein
MIPVLAGWDLFTGRRNVMFSVLCHKGFGVGGLTSFNLVQKTILGYFACFFNSTVCISWDVMKTLTNED